jgi:hypothetical protein
MKGLGDKNPVEVDLYNYPKSKNFGDEPQPKQTNNGDWYEEIKQWLSEFPNATPEAVKAKWELLTGHKLNNEGLETLLKHLGLTGKPDMGT